MIQSFRDHHPIIHEDAFIHPAAVVIGQVIIEEGANIWPGAVLRGDMGPIRIGKNTSIQDGTICHMTKDYSETMVGDNVTVGHGAILHGCQIEDGCLIGMGSTLLDKAVIGACSLVAAGSLVTGGKNFAPHSFICGSPAKALRKISEKEEHICTSSVWHYQSLAQEYHRGVTCGG